MPREQLTAEEKAERKKSRQRDYYKRTCEAQKVKAIARAAKARLAEKILSLKEDQRYWSETWFIAEGRVREINKRLITLRTELGDLRLTEDYITEVSLKKPHGVRTTEILEDIKVDMQHLGDDLARAVKLYEYYKKRRTLANDQKDQIAQDIRSHQTQLYRCEASEKEDLRLIDQAHSIDPDTSAAPMDFDREARDFNSGDDEEGMRIPVSIIQAQAERRQELWRRYNELLEAGIDATAPEDDDDEAQVPDIPSMSGTHLHYIEVDAEYTPWSSVYN